MNSSIYHLIFYPVLNLWVLLIVRSCVTSIPVGMWIRDVRGIVNHVLWLLDADTIAAFVADLVDYYWYW